jgi:8-amino-7-oxononanoate synthase
MNIFDKVKLFNRHLLLQSVELYPYFQKVEGNDGPIVRINGKEVIMAGSNNYLGLSADPRVKQASINAIQKYGTSNSGSRFMNGTLDIHEELESELALFLGKESVITLTTGFQTNQGAIVPLIGPNDYLISDKDNHNSIHQGALITKGLFGKKNVLRYNHNNMEHLERQISRLPLESSKLIVVDGVFSMSGTIVNLPRLVELSNKYHAQIMLDEAHAIGVIGENGRGTGSHFNLEHDVDLITGTFSKSLGSIGGFIAGKNDVIEYIKHTSPALMFSASMAPSQVAAALMSLKIMKQEPERMENLKYLSNLLRNGIKDIGFEVLDGETPIIPVIIGDDRLTCFMWKELMKEKIFTNPVLSPGVPEGMQLLRVSLMATHTADHVETILNGFKKMKKYL